MPEPNPDQPDRIAAALVCVAVESPGTACPTPTEALRRRRDDPERFGFQALIASP
jgi:hypothetical protein